MPRHTRATMRIRPRRMAAVLSACIAAMAVVIGAAIPAAAAPGDIDWGTGNSQDYAYWSAQHYETCGNDGSNLRLTVSALAAADGRTDRYSMQRVSPGDCAAQNTTMTNDLPFPVQLRYLGGEDSGSSAPYQFEWILGWTDAILQPGETAIFLLFVGVPFDVPNASQGTAGSFWWQWAIDYPVISAEPDAVSITADETAVVPVLDNDTLTLGDDSLDPREWLIVTAVTGSDASEGSWAIADDEKGVTFTPADGFTGVARAVYTAALGVGGPSGNAEVTVTVTPSAGAPGQTKPNAPYTPPIPGPSDPPAPGPQPAPVAPAAAIPAATPVATGTGTLARTGAGVSPWLIAPAGALVAAGLALLGIARRRRRT